MSEAEIIYEINEAFPPKELKIDLLEKAISLYSRQSNKGYIMRMKA